MKLLEHFKELTIHSKNAQELKGLILQLAIQGKLTQKWREQNPDIEPASVLLEKIEEEKAQLIKDKKIKKEKPLPEITKDEIPFELPNGWEFDRLGKVSMLKSGTTFNKTMELSEGEYKYIKVGGMNLVGNELEITTSAIYINPTKKDLKALIPEQSIIFPKRGGAIATNKKRIVKELIFVDLNTMAITSHANIDFYYIKTWFDSIDLWKLNNGTSVPQINNKDIAPLIIPIPPLEEQRAIVATVNQLFKEVEELEDQTKARVKLKEDFVTSALKQLAESAAINGEWKFLQEHFKAFFNTKDAVKKLRESILQLAVQGKLTSHWRSQNPCPPLEEVPTGGGGIEHAATLLEKIKAEKEQLIAAKKIKKEKALPAIEANEIPFELPESWVWSNILDISLKVTDGEHATPKRTDEGYMLLSARNVTNEGIRLHKVDYVGIEEFQRIRKRCDPQKGDILISCSGSVGRVCLVDKDDEYCMVRSAALVKHHHGYINGMFLCFALRSIVVQEQILEKSRSTAQSNLFLGKIKELIFPLPPLEEQKAIVEKVNSLMALCDQLEQEIVQNTKQVEDLMQSCLREVFEPVN